MPRRETVLSVFVASPSDVDDERNCLEEVIDDLNLAWARNLGFRLELIRWETHAYPAFGSSPQAVINEQVPDDYDLFVGLMWYRFGTPTQDAGSGTYEEFSRAKTRFDADPHSLQLMIYFKDAPAPVPPTQLDYSQITQVTEFRSTLGEAGGLYWTFRTIDEFENLVRLHLTRFVQSKKSEMDATKKPKRTLRANASSQQPIDNSDEHDLGLLDLTEKVQDEFLALVEITENIASATAEVGSKIGERTNEIEELSRSPESKNVKSTKRIIVKAAADMDQYSHRMEAELPLFSNHLNSGMNALTKAAEISIDFIADDAHVDEVRENIDSIRQFRETMTSVGMQLTEFRESVSSLPRLTTVLNRSKRRMAQVIQRIIDEFRGAQRMAEEAEASFESIVRGRDQSS